MSFKSHVPVVNCLPHEIRIHQPDQTLNLLKQFFKLKRNLCDQSVATNIQAWLHPHKPKQLQIKYILNKSLARKISALFGKTSITYYCRSHDFLDEIYILLPVKTDSEQFSNLSYNCKIRPSFPYNVL